MIYIGSLDYDVQLRDTDGIIIFGGGSMLSQLLNKLEQLDLRRNIVAICDNNIDVQGKELLGISVLGPDDIFRQYKGLDFIVYNQYFMEICEQLHTNHITRIHLIRQGSL